MQICNDIRHHRLTFMRMLPYTVYSDLADVLSTYILASGCYGYT